MTLKDKQNFIDACNSIDGIDFISVALWYLQKIETKDELNDFVGIFGGIFKVKSIDASETLTELCLLLRDRVYDILIANGDVPENNYIHLYNYFSLCVLQEDSRYTAYEQFVDQNLYGDGISDMERMFLLVLRFFSSFANSRNDAFVKFFTDVTKLNIVEVGSIDFSGTVIDFLNVSSIQIEDVLPIVTELLEKERYFARSKVDRRSLFNWLLHGLWLVQKYFNHPSWTSLYPNWKVIFYEHIARDECDEAMYVHFFIYHFMGNSFQTQAEWKMFNDEIDRPAAEYYKAWGDRANLPKCKAEQSSGRKIIGILQDRFVENSPFKVLYSVLKDVTNSSEFRELYEIRIYLMSYFEKSENDQKCIDMIERLGIKVWDGAGPFYRDGIYHSHLNKALYIRQKIIDDGVDILIHGGCYDIYDFLVATRMAPKQVCWIHGNFEYDIPNIDKRITHIDKKTYQKQSDYEVEHFDFETEERYTNPEEEKNKALAEKVKAKFPKDTVVLGSIGRLVKMDNYEYLGVVAKIMQQYPDAIYLACGGGNIDSVREKAIEVGVPIDRWYFEGHVDPHIYGYVIDVYLDTFPERGGQSVVEFLEKNASRFVVSYTEDTTIFGYDSIKKYIHQALEYLDLIKYIGKQACIDGLPMTIGPILGKANFEPQWTNIVYDQELENSYKNEIESIRGKFSENTIFLGFIGRLESLHEDSYYLSTVFSIMKRCPNTVFIFCGTDMDDKTKKNITESGIASDRFIFEKLDKYKVVLYVIDIFLDTFLYSNNFFYSNFILINPNYIVLSSKTPEVPQEDMESKIERYLIIFQQFPKNKTRMYYKLYYEFVRANFCSDLTVLSKKSQEVFDGCLSFYVKSELMTYADMMREAIPLKIEFDETVLGELGLNAIKKSCVDTEEYIENSVYYINNPRLILLSRFQTWVYNNYFNLTEFYKKNKVSSLGADFANAL